MMKRFLAFAVIAALGVFPFGCGSNKGTTENKTQTTTTQTKDGKTTGESKFTATETTKTSPPAAPGTGHATSERTTKTTVETTK